MQLPDAPPGRNGWPWTVAFPTPPAPTVQPWPRISVVVPSYQQGSFLEECLRSLLLQDYPALELIVIDGGSKDGSVEVLRRYAPFLAYWHSRPDQGQGDAINQGFEHATGDIIGWLNSDDLSLPGALQAVARAFRATDADLVFGDALNLHQADQSLDYWQAYWVRPAFLQFGGVIASHATFWRRRVHQPIWTDLQCNVDGELWQRLVPGRRLHYLPQPLGVYRAHEDTKSHAAEWKARWRHDDELIWARHRRPTRNRFFRRGFSLLQKTYQRFSWYRNLPAKRAVIQATGWQEHPWRGRTP